MAIDRRARLIDAIYETVLIDPDPSSLAALLMQAIPCGSAVIYTARPGHPVVGATANQLEATFQPYVDYYHTVDPWAAAGLAGGAPFKGMLSSEFLSKQDFMKTEFFVDFAKGIGVAQALGGYVPLAGSGVFWMAVHRDVNAPDFAEEHRRQCESLLPHLQRSIQLKERLLGASAAQAGLAALDALAAGIIVCDAKGRVVFANAAAEAATRAGSCLTLGASASGLGVNGQSEERRLKALIADAATGGAGGGLSIAQAAGTPLLVLVAPLPKRFAQASSLVLVAIQQPDAKPHFDPARGHVRPDARRGTSGVEPARRFDHRCDSEGIRGEREYAQDPACRDPAQDQHQQPARVPADDRIAAQAAKMSTLCVT